MKRERVSIVGAGRVGTALAVLLRRHGYPVVGVASRTLNSAQNCARLVRVRLATTDPAEAAKPGDMIFITTPDGVIREVCEQIARGGGFKRGNLVVHTSGALDSDELVSAKKKGALALSMHPIQSFVDLESAIEKLRGSYFGLEGNPDAVERGKELVAALKGTAVVIPKGAKTLYHAAACVASNYLVALIDVSLKLWDRAGVPDPEGLKMLLPLIRGTVENVERAGVSSALTGPIERGEVQVLRKQVTSIRDRAPDLLEIFAALADYTLEVAKRKPGLPQEKAQKLRELLREIRRPT